MSIICDCFHLGIIRRRCVYLHTMRSALFELSMMRTTMGRKTAFLNISNQNISITNKYLEVILYAAVVN